MKTKTKLFAAALAGTAMFSAAALSSNALSGDTYGNLYTSYHYIPILQDVAGAQTATTVGLDETGCDDDILYAVSTAYAYNGSGDYTTASMTRWGIEAWEGWGRAETKIRSTKRAEGVHTGGSLGWGSKTCYTSWAR